MTVLKMVRIISILLNIKVCSCVLDYQTYCPYSQSCSNATYHQLAVADNFPCCKPCSCSDKCHLLGQCCPDATYSNSLPVRYPCRNLVEIYATYLNISGRNILWSEYSFSIIDGCPDGRDIQEQLEDDRYRCYNAMSVEDLIFVTGNITKHTYLNEHCAKCNGETEFIKWSLHMNVVTYGLAFASFEERDLYIMTTGAVTPKPPSAEIALSAYCFAHSHQYCNSTGKWDYFDDELKHKCYTIYSPYFEVTTAAPSFSIFPNVYCFLCNSPRGTTPRYTCNEIADLVFPGRGTNVALPGYILQILVGTAQGSENKPTQADCARGQFLERLQMQCTDLFCPPGFQPDTGECRPLFGITAGVIVGTSFQVILPTGTDETTLDFRKLLKDINNVLKRRYDDGTVRCNLCSAELVSVSSGDFYVILMLTSTSTCSHVDILEIFASAFRAKTINIYSQVLAFKFKLVPKGLLEWTSLAASYASLGSTCVQHIFYSPGVVHCRSIDINVASIIFDNQISISNSVQKMLDEISTLAFDQSNGTYKVCLTDYERVLKSAGANSSVSLGLFFMTLTLPLFRILLNV